jgi:DAK2 domain fusion protein YloV
MTQRTCDGAGLVAAFRAAVANLEAHVEEVNELNVFPVPDGDTGSNMLATVRVALDEAESVASQPAGRVAAALSFGALMGARGNSGVITSQICRGIAEGLEGKRRFNGLDLAHALSRGAELAYAAVGKPVEGTILTVIREAAVAATVAAEHDDAIEAVLGATVRAAEAAVARTPSLLPILREAGVVDSGGQGLYRLFQGALLHLAGRSPAGSVGARLRAGAKPSTLVAHSDEGFGYETMLLIQPQPGASLDPDTIRRAFETIGESVVVVGDGKAVKIHVHNEHPDQVLAHALTLGSLSRISVENLDHQALEVRERRATEFTASQPAGVEAHAAPTERASVPLAVVAVTAGEGLAAIFRDFGVAAVVQGGQAANPSTGELLQAIESVNAIETLLLPNNPNVILAARQVAGMTSRAVYVIPTRNAAEGIAALLVLDPSHDGAANVDEMTAAGRAIESLSVTTAVRDAKVSGRKVRRGQTIVLDPDDGLVAVDSDRDRAIEAAIQGLRPGIELITLFYGEGADLAEAEATARRITATLEGVEVEVRHGGQPHYRYLISAE